MSQENVEIVRRAMEQFGELAPRDTPQFVDQFWNPEADYYPVRKIPDPRPCHGREEIARFFAEYLDNWDRWEYTIKRLIAVGDDRVFVHAVVHAEGRESGINLESDLFQCYWLRHGRIFRQEDHLTLPGALHALGLSGESLEAAGLSE